MSDFGMGAFSQTLVILLVIALPLALWKFAEVVIWVFSHISIN